MFFFTFFLLYLLYYLIGMSTDKNRFFAKYGHECDVTSSLNDLPMFRHDSNILTQIKRLLIRSRMASELNKRGYRFLRSQRAIEMEHRKHIKCLYIIHPFSLARKWWEVFMLFVLAVVFIMIPLDLASFECPLLVKHLNRNNTWKWTRLIFDFFCLSDVIMNFFTGYCDHKCHQVVLNPKAIAVRYVLTYFLPDLLSSIPTHMDLIFSYGNENDFRQSMTYLQYTSCIKLMRMVTFHKYFKRFAEAFDINYAVYKVTMALFYYLVYFHIITCINMVLYGYKLHLTIPRGHASNSKIWLDKNNNTILFVKAYCGTFFRSVHMVSNSAPGLQLQENISVKIYVIIVWFVSKLMFFYLVSQLLDVVRTVRSSKNKYKEMVRQLREYMRHKQLPESLQRRLIGYYEFRFQKSYFRESEIMNTISGQLRQEIVMHSCRKLVENVDFFKNLPLPLIVRIVSALTSDIYLTNDVIIKANTKGDHMYFIASGCVSIYTKSGKELCHLEDGNYFGEVALIRPSGIREASAVAVEICELYKLDRNDFIKAILPYPDLMEKINKIADDRMETTQYLDERNRTDMRQNIN